LQAGRVINDGALQTARHWWPFPKGTGSFLYLPIDIVFFSPLRLQCAPNTSAVIKYSFICLKKPR